jgi:hypothetical protein
MSEADSVLFGRAELERAFTFAEASWQTYRKRQLHRVIALVIPRSQDDAESVSVKPPCRGTSECAPKPLICARHACLIASAGALRRQRLRCSPAGTVACG